MAALLVGAEGAAGLITAIVFVVRGLAGSDQRIVNGFGNAAWFGILGAAILVAAWALWTGRRWGRGIAVFTQLLILPATWYMGVGSHQWFYGIPIAAVALEGADTVALAMGRPAGPGLRVRYADRTRHGGLGGLHDSDPALADDAYEFDPLAGHDAAAAAPGWPGRLARPWAGCGTTSSAPRCSMGAPSC